MDDKELIKEIEAQISLMIDAVTGKWFDHSDNLQYKNRREIIWHGLNKRDIDDPNSYYDLNAWWRKCSSGDLPTYKSRRGYVSDLYTPIIDAIRRGPTSRGKYVFDKPTGWPKVDRGLDKIREQLAKASGEEEFQAVGFFCRETLISLAQAVYNPDLHAPLDGVTPSETDAKPMLEAYINHELRGGPNKEARAYARDALTLANKLVHDRTASFRDAVLCAEATTSIINIISIISGRREKG